MPGIPMGRNGAAVVSFSPEIPPPADRQHSQPTAFPSCRLLVKIHLLAEQRLMPIVAHEGYQSKIAAYLPIGLICHPRMRWCPPPALLIAALGQGPPVLRNGAQTRYPATGRSCSSRKTTFAIWKSLNPAWTKQSSTYLRLC
jgi:hypothetical protein